MLDILFASTEATLKVVLVCSAGAYLEKVQIFNSDVRKAISEMVVKLLLPCFLFARIVKTVSIETLPAFGFLAFANLVYVFVGCTIGKTTVMVTQPARGMRSVLSVVPGIGHANAIPLVLITLICSEANGFGSGDAQRGEGYVGLYLLMHSVTLWGVGMSVISKKAVVAPTSTVVGTTLGATSVVPALNDPKASDVKKASEDVGSDADAQAEEWAESVSSVGMPPPVSTTSTPKRRFPCSAGRMRRLVPKWFNRPVAAAFSGVVLGFVPAVQQHFVSTTGRLHFVYQAMDTVGTAGPVVSLLTVGALFVADGFPTPAVIGYKPLMGVIVGRLLLLPVCCICLWMTLRRLLSFFPSDPVFMIVLCIECCTPSAYNLVTMCVLQGHGAKELAAALFYQNLVAVFTLTAWTTIIMWYVVSP